MSAWWPVAPTVLWRTPRPAPATTLVGTGPQGEAEALRRSYKDLSGRIRKSLIHRSASPERPLQSTSACGPRVTGGKEPPAAWHISGTQGVLQDAFACSWVLST